ncbi:aspartic proteinase nepenthesin-1-like [Rhododendron vialii]|uniref:aspartic proteinase nepenthesin-1-like n=1 Tax=Rhododendron vialii TaxID=182163 RepID=UPI00265D8EDB|nr:aspartic proteinase nepenthesin-1-like [Rhododendron vialii]
MASSPPSLSSFLFLTLALILISISPAFSTPRRALDNHQDQLMKTGFKVTLNHIDSGESFTKSERLYRAVKRSNARLQKFNEMVSTANQPELTTTVYAGPGAYFMNFSIGTPPNSYSALMDTGSDLIWTQCQPCLECVPQSDPFFDPKKSSSFSNVSCTSKYCLDLLPYSNCNPFYGCVYIYEYGSGITSGFLGTETFTFEKVKVPKVTFGCGLFNLGFDNGTEGLIGLGRGPLSLISQLREPQFSYCLTSYGDAKPSTLLIGSQRAAAGPNKTTPLLQNPFIPTFYYLSLEGITIGSTRLPVNKTTFQINPDGSGGVILDSGTTITYLDFNAYLLVREQFIKQVKLPVVDVFNVTGLDLCFKLPPNPASVVIPKLIFHFTGADVDLPTENYFLGNSSIFIPGLGVTCLAIEPSFGFSIYGNVQQQNYMVLYDLSKNTVSFTPTQCDKY